MKFPRIFVAVALLLAVTACSVQSTSGGTAPQSSTGFMGMKKDDFDVSVDKAFAGRKEVVIGSFKINFIDDKKASAKAGMGYGGRSTAALKLNGVDAKLMQKITDAAYADFISKLKANGYTLANRADLLAHPDFKKVNTEKSPFREEASFFGRQVTTTYFAPTELGSIYWAGEEGHIGGFGFSNPMMGASVYADKTKIPVLFVSYTVDFANSDGDGGRFASTSSMSVGQGVSIAPGGGINLFGGQGGSFSTNSGHIKLGQPVYSTDTFGEVVNTTSDTYKATETALNVVSAVLGGGTNITRKFEINADPAKYQAVTGKVLAETNAKLVGKMASLR